MQIRPVYRSDARITGMRKEGTWNYDIIKDCGSSFILNPIVEYSSGCLNNKYVYWSTNTPDVVKVRKDGYVTCLHYGHAEIRATSVYGGKSVWYSFDVANEAVDLGLSVKWCSNIYGGIDKHNDYYWSEEGRGVTWPGSASYNGWRVPTADEWQELLDNCQVRVSTSNYDSYCVVTSPITGRTIYLPPLYGGDDDSYGSGYYWTSTSSDYYYDNGAKVFRFNRDGVDIIHMRKTNIALLLLVKD